MSTHLQEAPAVDGWTWRQGEPCRALRDWQDVADAWQESESLFWIDLEDPSREAVDRLGDLLGLDAAVRDDCLHAPERPRVDEYDDYLVLFFYGVVSADASTRFSPGRVSIVCGKRFLVTVHDAPVLSVQTLLARCRRHGASLFARGVDVLLCHLIDAMVDQYLELIDHYDEDISELEAASLDATGEVVLTKAARLRRELMEIRRLAGAQQTLLAPVARGEFDYVSESLSTEVRHIQEHLAHSVDRVEALRERVTGALGNYQTTLAKRTNDIVRVLTVSAALVLPLTLISGIYGMNLPLWPPVDAFWSFWAVLAFMGVTAAGLLWFFRTREWF